VAGVCLLVVASRVVEGTPLLIGANRDELLNRPATPMTVLRPSGPRILGGRDEQSGGTWLAVNEHGVCAGLTNQPRAEGRDPTRRTRGELPLALATQPTAAQAAESLLAGYRPADYNGSWLLVGDRDTLYFIDFTGLVQPEAVPLSPGLHVLENRSLRAPSPKADRVAALLEGWPADRAAATAMLARALADHWTAEPDGPNRILPNCVHLEEYGTRSSCIVAVGDDHLPPQIMLADGPPCTTPFVDANAGWLVTL
jgi:uncharacterized protein with NRDE domain